MLSFFFFFAFKHFIFLAISVFCSLLSLLVFDRYYIHLFIVSLLSRTLILALLSFYFIRSYFHSISFVLPRYFDGRCTIAQHHNSTKHRACRWHTAFYCFARHCTGKAHGFIVISPIKGFFSSIANRFL